MPTTFAFDPQSFKGAEHAGWERAAPVYATSLGRVTAPAAAPLLDATRVGPGTRLLELCCGPGYGAGLAARRGATAVGVDFAEAMVRVARATHPQAVFHQEDVEALPFGDASFDAVTCAFGISHVPDPDKMLAEAWRVLVPGGRVAFTMWCAPDTHALFGLILGAIREHGTLEVPLPPAPPVFRFSDPTACRDALHRAGFVDPAVTQLPLAYCPRRADDVLDFTYKVAVRMVMILDAQAADARERIHRAIVEGAARVERDGRIEIQMPAVLASAGKP
jgi:SAM-dependent methyltransferase